MGVVTLSTTVIKSPNILTSTSALRNLQPPLLFPIFDLYGLVR